MPRDATSPEKLTIRGNIVPHGRKGRSERVYKGGRFNAIELPPQSYNQVQLTRGPSTCQPPHCHVTPPERPRGLTWPRPHICVTLRNLSAVWARAAMPHGLACRVAFAQVSRTTSALRATSAPQLCRNKTLFLHFKNRLKSKLKSRKI